MYEIHMIRIKKCMQETDKNAKKNFYVNFIYLKEKKNIFSLALFSSLLVR
jgi:hypothetical protein